MKPEDQIAQQVETLHREGSAALVAASRAALRGEPLSDTDRPVTLHLLSPDEVFGPDAVVATEDGVVREIIEVMRGGTRSLKPAVAQLAMSQVQEYRPRGADPDGLTWWHAVRAQQMDPDGFALAEEAMDWHLRCAAHGCWELPHQGDQGKPEKMRVGLPQAPVYLYCDWLSDFTTDQETVLIVLGCRGKGGPGQPVLNFYKADEQWWGPDLSRFILTPHPVYLERLAAFVTAATSARDLQLIRDIATLMWLDTDLGTERHTWSGTAGHDLVHEAALDGANPREGKPLHRPLQACPCHRCAKRRTGASA